MKYTFYEIYRNKIHRDGAKELLAWLANDTDFFEAPCSTRFHLCQRGGLVEHSIDVYRRLHSLYTMVKTKAGAPGVYHMTEAEEESIAIVALLHDVCKANFYVTDTRNVKNKETGIWEVVPFYTVNDQFPMGHGEKSLYLIMKYMRLSDEEAMAIRWHMGFSDESFKGGSYALGNAFDKYPLAVLMHTADLIATNIDEK